MKKKLLESSIILTVIYTIGHVLIAMACNMVINKEISFDGALADAIIEPLINAVWFYIIHKLVKDYFVSKKNSSNLASN